MSKSVEEKIIRSHCRLCHGACGMLVHVRDGVVVKVEGDPENPMSHGSLCAKGLASIQVAYHPDRLRYPIKRTGAKGEGKWERISWDEALDTITNKYKEIIKENGSESIVIGQGTGRDYESYLYRFANYLGTPNVLTAGHQCYVSRIGATLITCGMLPVVDYVNNPKCTIVWGCNPQWTNPDEYVGENLSRTLAAGTKLIVVDPRLTHLSSRADVWLQLRPGTDTALAFGMLNVIINEGLYDREFVEKWTHGWEQFVERVNEYPVDKVAKITWVPAEKIQEAARLYATTKPAAINWGISIEQTLNCTDNNRILNDMMAITGNLDVPGGNVLFVPPPVYTTSQFARHRDLPKEQQDKQLGGERFKLAKRVALITPKVCWDAIMTGKPYPVRAVQLHGSNPVTTRANGREVYDALKKVEFLVVADLFMTPTTELADIVLPVATWLETDYVGDLWKRHGYVFARQKIIEVDECWPDYKMFNELGKKMGKGLGKEDYWWDTYQEGLDWLLEPSGLSFKQFVEKGWLEGKQEYRKYEQKGFSTPTRKVELYSTIMEGWGYDPLPTYKEPPEGPITTPELMKEYPYILTTGRRPAVFFHSANRQIPWLRELVPDPIIQMHPSVAEKHGIKDGDWVWIESPRGRVKQRAELYKGIDPRVVAAHHAWWFPEIRTPDHGWEISNINIITDNSLDNADVAVGANNLRALVCKIYPVKEEEAKQPVQSSLKVIRL